MKKIISILLSLVLIGTAAFAQNKETPKPAATEKKATKPKQVSPNAADRQPARNNMEQRAAESQTTMPAGKTKKDGTPDMRYKENKTATKPAVKVKKDGTPDMRYKANKEAANKK